MPTEEPRSLFPATSWTEIGKSSQPSDQAQESLDRLIRLYWRPLSIYLIATFPTLRNQAEVLLQEFAEDKILKEGWLKRADKDRGRFRDFIKKSLKNFVLDRLNRADSKRELVPIEELDVQSGSAENVHDQFDLMWIRTIVAQALSQMESDCKAPEREQPRWSNIWEIFRVRLLDPIFCNAAVPPYEELIERFSLRSPTDASNMLLGGKRSFKAHINKVIEEYEGKDAATDIEMNALGDFLARLEKEG